MGSRHVPPSLSFSLTLAIALALAFTSSADARIDRHALVTRYNPTRNASSTSTPMQVGNGHFAFGADVSGLQTFLPYGTLSDWGWKNDSLAAVGLTRADIESYRGVVWDGVQYEFGGPEPAQQWLISNPNRVNLGRVGLVFRDADGNAMNVQEEDVQGTSQKLDLWTGVMQSELLWEGERVAVRTIAAQTSDAIAVTVESALLADGRLALFLDFPWNDGSEKFEAPFVGWWNMTANHTTVLDTGAGAGLAAGVRARIEHTMDNSTFFTFIGGESDFDVSRVSPDAHRYLVVPTAADATTFAVSIAYAPGVIETLPQVAEIEGDSEAAWEDFWSNHGFVDVVSESTDPRADELQRRIILSQYLLRVNEAGDTPPQEVRLSTPCADPFERRQLTHTTSQGW